MKVDVDLGRVTLSLHGVSAQMAEEAVDGLGEELRRRLGALALGDVASFDCAELALAPFTAPTVLDAGALRGMIAERLTAAIFTSPKTTTEAAGGGS